MLLYYIYDINLCYFHSKIYFSNEYDYYIICDASY